MLSNIENDWGLRLCLMTKIDYHEKRKGYKYKNIQEMNNRFVIDFKNMTFDHFLAQKKQMMN